MVKKSTKKDEIKKSSKKTSILVEEDERKVAKEAKSQKTLKKEVTECKASARFLKISPKKVKLVIDEIRGLKTEEALNRLRLINKGSVPMIVKLLNSALANAEHNFKLKKEDLYIKHIAANQGPTLHRWKPAAFGRATPIRKRTTHLELVLAVKDVEKIDKIEKEKPGKKEVKTSKPVKKEVSSSAKATEDKKKEEIL